MQNQNSTESQSQNKGQNAAQNLSPEARSKDGQNSPGSFKNDPARAAEAGKKGGEASGGNRSGSSQSSGQ